MGVEGDEALQDGDEGVDEESVVFFLRFRVRGDSLLRLNQEHRGEKG